MLYGRFTFQITFNSEADLPPYKGSTLRGLLGVALKKVVCALKMQECHTCLLRERCLYRIIFEIPAAEGTMVSPSPPHPFILEPPLDLQTDFRAGDPLEFHLILLGSANETPSCSRCTECYLDLEGVFRNQKRIADLYGKLSGNRPLEEMSDSGIINLNAENFAMYKSRIRQDFQKSFGLYALKDLEIASTGKRPNTRYGLGMDKEKIEIVY
jgi:hypothetical protein